MNVCFEIAALFHSAIRCWKKCGNFKINIHLESVESFLYCLCSSSVMAFRLCLAMLYTFASFLTEYNIAKVLDISLFYLILLAS